MSTDRKLLRSAGTIGGLTGVSRVLGFIRDMVIAAAFGTGASAEAFVVSFKIPNLLRDLVGEGAANAAFVPVLTECRQKDSASYWALVNTLFWTMSAVLAALAFLGMLFAPQVVSLLAPGFLSSGDAEKFPLTVSLTRVMFPYVLLIGLSALAMGVLHSLREFTTSALGPILLNLCLIAAGCFFERRYGPMALAVGVLAGGVLQLAVQLPPLLSRGFRPTWRTAFPGSYAAKIGKLLIPRALGSAIYQINVFVDSILASFESLVGVGGQSALYYSNRLFQLPLAIFGIALAQAALPAFSAQMVQKDLDGFRRSFASAARSLMAFALPASAGLIVLCRPIIRIIFERGLFDAYSTSITSSALFFYAFGLLSCCLVKIEANAFYAMHDTRTPVKVMAFSLASNVALSLLFMRTLGIGGLALASSISSTLNAVVLYTLLCKRVGPFDERAVLSTFWKTLTASMLMAAAVWTYDAFFLERLHSFSRPLQSAALIGGIIGAVAIYAAAAAALGITEITHLFKREKDGHFAP